MEKAASIKLAAFPIIFEDNNMSGRLIPLFFLLLCCHFDVTAQSRSEQEVLQIAESFFKTTGDNAQPKLVIVSEKEIERHLSKRAKSSRGKNGCIMINDTNNHRFVIISKDERMYDILGYSDNGIFDAATTPDALLAIIAGYNNQYNQLLSDGLKELHKPAYTIVEPIPEMIQTKWNQREPYNNDCPLDNEGKRCVTGCVATAMAQVMNYYKYPQNGGGGIVSYEPNPFWGPQIGQSFNYDELAIDWNNITDDYGVFSTEIQKAEVAKLMHACGVSVYMDYGSSSSGADDADIAYAMIHNFGYNPNMYYADKNYYDISEWHALIQEELKTGRPILYGSGGHEYILDGMKENQMYHFNFGWAGTGDGYYMLDAITPVNTTLASDQTMVVGINTSETGIHKDIFFSEEFLLDTLVEVNNRAKITSLKPMCFSNEANTYNGKARFKGEYGVGLFDKDFNMVKSLYKYKGSFSSRSFQGSSASNGIWITFDASTFSNGKQYYIAPYARGEDSPHPTLIRTKAGYEDWYRATVKDGLVMLERKKEIPSEQDIILGDSNGDGTIDVADIVSLVNYIMQQSLSAFVFVNSDMDKDGEIDVADITLLIAEIMKQP